MQLLRWPGYCVPGFAYFYCAWIYCINTQLFLKNLFLMC